MRGPENRWLIVAGLAVGLAGPMHATDPAKTYGPTFGLSSGLFATGTTISISYYGWEATTYFGHTIFAMTTSEYANDLASNCFWFFAASNTDCGTALGDLQGTPLFSKPFVTADYSNPVSPPTVSLPWATGAEIIFALKVNQGDGNNWFFSGDPSRNVDGLAHLAFFSPLVYNSGVPGNAGNGFVPGTQGRDIYGFEDVNYQNSDWDFNNALFTLDGTGGPTDIVPEPVSMTLLGTGLVGLGAMRRRRRKGPAPG